MTKDKVHKKQQETIGKKKRKTGRLTELGNLTSEQKWTTQARGCKWKAYHNLSYLWKITTPCVSDLSADHNPLRMARYFFQIRSTATSFAHLSSRCTHHGNNHSFIFKAKVKCWIKGSNVVLWTNAGRS